MKEVIDLTGKKFMRWTVIERAESDKRNKSMWRCVCECGTERNVSANNLKSGGSRSCGCYNLELVTNRILGKSVKHGLSKKHPIYKVWEGIKQRCTNTNAFAFDSYGGRGISICNEWCNDFQSFYDWAIANGYAKGLTLDRIDNNGNYEPSNCRWATRKEQGRNKRNNIKIYYDGKEYTVAELSTKLNISRYFVQKNFKNLQKIKHF